MFPHHERPASDVGLLEPFASLQIPKDPRASRFVYPYLLVAAGDCSAAYLFDVPTTTLAKTLSLEELGANQVHYVDVSRTHAFVCTDSGLHIFDNATARLLYSWKGSYTNETIIGAFYAARDVTRSVNDGDYHLDIAAVDMSGAGIRRRDPTFSEGIFHAAHVSPCGQHLVAIGRGYGLVYWPYFADDIAAGTFNGYTLTLGASADRFVYLAFDGTRIVVCTVWITLRPLPTVQFRN